MNRPFSLVTRKYLVLWPVLTVCFLAALKGQEQSTAPGNDSRVPTKVTIPDGTPLELRFVKGVWGPQHRRCAPGNARGESKRGDTVRLVSIADVIVGGEIVIAKGALAQATVTKAILLPGSSNPFDPGCDYPALSLKFDWVTTVTGKTIALRAAKTGKTKSFDVDVIATAGGALAQPGHLWEGWGDFIRDLGYHTTTIKRLNHNKDWVPPGTRINAFTHGATDLRTEELREAQAHLPLKNPIAMVTIYRTADNQDDAAEIYCDDKLRAKISAHQYAVLELEPGPHSCFAEPQKPVELVTNAGEEYFISLQSQKHSFWELNLVSVGEGEDGIARSQMVEPEP